jgi:hypothetical protein
MYKNFHDKSGKMASKGAAAEERFEKILKANNMLFEKSDKKTDMRKHIDYFFILDGYIFSVDVKARKKVYPKDTEPNDDIIWIELHGVNEGNDGWLYGGDADLIAFENAKGFIVVPRTSLIKLVDDLVNKDVRVREPEQALYRIYQRVGRLDELTLIEMKTIREIMCMELIE